MSAPAPTTFATLARRDNDPLGYYIHATTSGSSTGTTTQLLTCNQNDHFATSGTFGGCYAATYLASSLALNIGCTIVPTPTGSTLNGIVTCSATNKCITQTIYKTYPDISSLKNYFCAINYPATLVYQELPYTNVVTTSSTSSTSSSSSSSSSTSTPASTSSSSASTASTTPTPTSSPTPTPSSKAWIAGPAIGAVALIALLGFLVWFIRKRRSRAAAAPYSQHMQDQKSDIAYAPVNMGSRSPLHAELGDGGEFPPRELAGRDYPPPRELPG